MKKTHIIALIALAVLFGVILTKSNEYSSYKTFAEAKVELGKEFHVAGNFVKEKGIQYNPENDANVFSFFMDDTNGNRMYVVCSGDKPKDFEMSEQLVVIGKAQQTSSDTTFFASDMLVKCPSKYVDEQVALK